MFEKEAEEYATRDVFFDGVPKPVINHQRKEDWQKGAEFGYNKANEWHYVKGGDFPTDRRKMTLIINGKTYEAGELIAYVQNLEQNNAELKESNKMLAQGYVWYDYDAGEDCYEDSHKGKWVKRDEVQQLTEAKEIIELLLSDNRIMKAQFESEEQANIWFEHIHQAEQFLKETE